MFRLNRIGKGGKMERKARFSELCAHSHVCRLAFLDTPASHLSPSGQFQRACWDPPFLTGWSFRKQYEEGKPDRVHGVWVGWGAKGMLYR